MLEDRATTRLRRPLSEYLGEHFRFATQPIEEPEDPEHLRIASEALGMTDRILYSSDCPHWDFDAPGQTLPRSVSEEGRAAIMAGNAVQLCGLAPRPAAG